MGDMVESHATPARSRAGLRPGRRRDAAGTREALLAAGAELFAERGYDGVPVWLIADRARVNKAMISYHFGGKRQLYLEILASTFSEIVARVEALADLPRPAPELLREVVTIVADAATRRHPHLATMMLREVLAGGKRLEAQVIDKPVRLLAAVRRIVERGVREGSLRPVDPVLTHLSLVGSLVFFFATARFRERMFADRLRIKAPDAAAYVLHIQELFMRGLAARRGEARPPARQGTPRQPVPALSENGGRRGGVRGASRAAAMIPLETSTGGSSRQPAAARSGSRGVAGRAEPRPPSRPRRGTERRRPGA
jgi:AcrR family transcriptional regulator